jgi:histidine phosphotransfer protein HptB
MPTGSLKPTARAGVTGRTWGIARDLQRSHIAIQGGRTTEETGVRSQFADDDDFRELLEVFVQGIPEKCEIFRDLRARGATDDIRVMAHQLKGAAGGYGFPGVSTAASKLEESCKSQKPDAIARSLEELLGYLHRVEA